MSITTGSQFSLFVKSRVMTIRLKWIRSAVPIMCTSIWLAIICGSVAALHSYETTAAKTTASAPQWPTGIPLPRPATRPVLIIMLHPNCPCSRASIAELAELLARHPSQLTAYAVFTSSPGTPQDPATVDIWTTAASTPGLIAIRDNNATIGHALHATTSGQIFLYDSTGTLQFTGGITPSRAHTGDNFGSRSIETFLTTGVTPRSQTSVFGCALY